MLQSSLVKVVQTEEGNKARQDGLKTTRNIYIPQAKSELESN